MYRRDKIELNELDPNNWNNILTKKNDTIHRLDKGSFLSEDNYYNAGQILNTSTFHWLFENQKARQ